MAAEEVYDYSEHPLDEGEDGRPLTDEEKRAIEVAERWFPDVYEEEDYLTLEEDMGSLPIDVTSVTASEFAQFALRMPTMDGWEPFSFEGRRHMYQPYDSEARRMLFMCGRQVEKSTLLGNKALAYSCLIPAYKTLYVSPSATQTKTFSNDRIKDPIETSPVLRAFTSTMLSQNILEKQFINRSKITLRYAFLNADRARGIPANSLFLDELQDVLSHNIPVLEMCTAHSPEPLKRYIYSGTPKTLDNVIEDYWSNRSTQNQWVVPCDAHGGDTGRYWNILGEKNIGKKGLICEKCGRLINSMNEGAQWASTVSWHPQHTPFEGYRIPQLMVPWIDWSELLYNYAHYERAKFYNEVLGISFDTGYRPLSVGQIRDSCSNSVHMGDVDKYQSLSFDQEIFAGIDWGGGTENSYTVLSLGLYVGNKFRIIYVHRFSGEESEPAIQLQKIETILRAWNVRVAGVDWGGGQFPNDHLVRIFGHERIQKYQYVARLNGKVRWEAPLQRWIVHRTEVMSALFSAIKRGNVLEFPRWQEFKEPYAKDMLAIFSTYNEKLRMTMYDKTPGVPDDTFHSILYCFLASMIRRPRPDIISPTREEPNRGPVLSSYGGPTNQYIP